MAEGINMSDIRRRLKVIVCAVPVSMADAFDRITIEESYENKSDLLRKILLEYIYHRIPAEQLAEIIDEIKQTEANRP